MKRVTTRKKAIVWVVVVSCAILVLSLTACAPKKNSGIPTPSAEPVSVTPETDQFGTVKAESWKDIYPHQYETYMQNLDNNEEGKANYLEVYPEIKTLGKGYGYAKYYTEPVSHLYSLDTVGNNGRISDKTKANCITCKSGQYTAITQKYGDEAFTMNFKETLASLDEPISCYNCHENDPTHVVVTQQNWIRAMGNDADKAPVSAQVCGQCHNDYYFDKNTGVTSNPYNGLASMNPTDSLAWYDNIDLYDWIYESTGAKMIVVRHPEFEYLYGGEKSHMADLGYSCSNCHMAPTTAKDGTVYSSHNWISPLENQELIDRDCSKCHSNIKAQVAAWQEDLDGRTHQIGLRAENFIQNFEAAINNGTITDAEKSRLQVIQREAVFFWNFVAAENSEGAHNPTLTTETLDKAEILLNEADEILGMSSVEM